MGVSKVGSLSCHQIDMRDHRSPDRPWEFLLDDEEYEAAIDYMTTNATRHALFGNRVRLSEFMSAAQSNGWQTVYLKREHEEATKEGLEYVKKAIRRLNACEKCRYRNWTRDDLDGCTSNKMPMTGVEWCVRYGGSDFYKAALHGELPKCGQDVWTKSDFNFKSDKDVSELE